MPTATLQKKGLSRSRQQQALSSLEVPIPLGSGRKLTPAEELVRLHDRLVALSKPANPYQRSFTLFRTRLCFTKDEAGGGYVARLPDWEYLRELDEHLILGGNQGRLFIEKSRRVLASWVMCAFDIWIAAGGQDPRWPALMRSTRNRQVILAARKLEDPQGSAWYLEERCAFILREFEQRGLRRFWPDFPEWKHTFASIHFSNGSRIDAVPHGADQMRSIGATVIHCEEVSFWPEARAAINAALPALRGGGHLVCISTPQVDTFAHKLVKGELRHVAGRSATRRLAA